MKLERFQRLTNVAEESGAGTNLNEGKPLDRLLPVEGQGKCSEKQEVWQDTAELSRAARIDRQMNRFFHNFYRKPPEGLYVLGQSGFELLDDNIDVRGRKFSNDLQSIGVVSGSPPQSGS